MLGLTKLISKFRNSPSSGTDERLLSDEERVFWDEHGYLVLPGFFSGPEIDHINSYVNSLWKPGIKDTSRVVIDTFVGTDKEKRVRLKDAPSDAAFFPYKLNDLYLESEVIRDLVLSPSLGKRLAELLNGIPMACNTLNFTYGSQQPFHTDSLYMPAPVDLNLVATWIALEDCDDDAGPLQYYPGSHRIPPYKFSHGKISAIPGEMTQYSAYMQSQVDLLRLKPQRFCARKGDVFIWHSQLFHGGSAIDNFDKTRRSLVTHYWRSEDCANLRQEAARGGFYWARDPQPVNG